MCYRRLYVKFLPALFYHGIPAERPRIALIIHISYTYTSIVKTSYRAVVARLIACHMRGCMGLITRLFCHGIPILWGMKKTLYNPYNRRKWGDYRPCSVYIFYENEKARLAAGLSHLKCRVTSSYNSLIFCCLSADSKCAILFNRFTTLKRSRCKLSNCLSIDSRALYSFGSILYIGLGSDGCKYRGLLSGAGIVVPIFHKSHSRCAILCNLSTST